MGRFLEMERETWYFGGGSESLRERGVLAFFGDFFWSFGVVFATSSGAVDVVGVTSSAFVGSRLSDCAGLGCDEEVFGLLSARGCLEGRVGFCSGGCALSPSVRDSAAARSAARWASWGVDGCSEEAFGGSEGVLMGAEFAGGSVARQLIYTQPMK